MKKQIWLAAGIAGMLLGSPTAQAEVNVHIGAGGNRPPSFVLDTRPNFINVPNLGFYVSVGGPQDVISYNNRFYVNHRGAWYVSSNFRGPWVVITEGRLPRQIRRHGWDEIRRFRDVEYRRHDSRYNRDHNFRERDPRDRNFNHDDRRPDDRGNINQNNPGPDNRPNDGGRRN